MSLAAVLLLAAGAGTIPLIFVQQRRSLHLLQLEHYENRRLLVWVRRRGELIALPQAPVRLLLAAVSVVLAAEHTQAAAESAAVFLLLATNAWEARPHLRRGQIKPLVYTSRARLILVTAVSAPAGVWLVALGLSATGRVAAAAVAAGLITASTLAPALLTASANRALSPWQRHVNRRFVNAATSTLASVDPRVVGITGSYGKTTTKVCVGSVLEQSQPTLITPASFNSYLGIVRTINEHLRPAHRNFVVEMGMYRAGDIRELCELTHPTIGVITAIGPAHLERMGSLDAIQAAKAELAQALPPDGWLVTNADDPRCLQIAAATTVKTTLYGLNNPAAEVRAEHVAITDGRTSFDLVLAGERTSVTVNLLGAHNVSNLLAAAAVGLVVGMPTELIKRGLEAVEPPEHRLQPLPNAGSGVVVIDDAYNSNPAGAAAALQVLADHPAARRILVTPGMVELGDLEAFENERFGQLAAPVCDHVILVGPTRTQPIRAGLEQAGFDTDAIHVVPDIHGATAVLARLTRAGDVILFENDLPDLYAEDGSNAA
ncbi:MAG: UDP-N-acetylmuramoyl-tripeptide--D-alanyl-D-alanine ligase [Solirubrobacteraceae bacterium]